MLNLHVLLDTGLGVFVFQCVCVCVCVCKRKSVQTVSCYELFVATENS